MSKTSISGAMGDGTHSIAEVLRDKIIAGGGNPNNSYNIAELIGMLPDSGGGSDIPEVDLGVIENTATTVAVTADQASKLTSGPVLLHFVRHDPDGMVGDYDYHGYTYIQDECTVFIYNVNSAEGITVCQMNIVGTTCELKFYFISTFDA